MSQLLGAYITGGLVGLLVGAIAMTGFVLWLQAPADPDTEPENDDATVRIPPANVIDLRRNSREWTA